MAHHQRRSSFVHLLIGLAALYCAQPAACEERIAFWIEGASGRTGQSFALNKGTPEIDSSARQELQIYLMHFWSRLSMECTARKVQCNLSNSPSNSNRVILVEYIDEPSGETRAADPPPDLAGAERVARLWTAAENCQPTATNVIMAPWVIALTPADPGHEACRNRRIVWIRHDMFYWTQLLLRSEIRKWALVPTLEFQTTEARQAEYRKEAIEGVTRSNFRRLIPTLGKKYNLGDAALDEYARPSSPGPFAGGPSMRPGKYFAAFVADVAVSSIFAETRTDAVRFRSLDLATITRLMARAQSAETCSGEAARTAGRYLSWVSKQHASRCGFMR